MNYKYAKRIAPHYVGADTNGIEYSGNAKEFKEPIKPCILKQYRLLLREYKYYLKNNETSACKVLAREIKTMEKKYELN